MKIVCFEVLCRNYETYLEKYIQEISALSGIFHLDKKCRSGVPVTLWQKTWSYYIGYKLYICYYVLVAMCPGSNVLGQLVVSYLQIDEPQRHNHNKEIKGLPASAYWLGWIHLLMYQAIK